MSTANFTSQRPKQPPKHLGSFSMKSSTKKNNNKNIGSSALSFSQTINSTSFSRKKASVTSFTQRADSIKKQSAFL